MNRPLSEVVPRWVHGAGATRRQALSVLGAAALLLGAVLCGLVVLQG
jgi:hypothetical protein